MTGRIVTAVVVALTGAISIACGDGGPPSRTTRLTVTLEPTGWAGCEISTADGCAWRALSTTVTVACHPAQLTGAGSDARPDGVCDAIAEEAALTHDSGGACSGVDRRIQVDGTRDGAPVAATITPCLGPRPVDRWFTLLDIRPGSAEPPV